MSWSREGGRSGPRGYHHGNLKEALIRAALELIAQKGPAGFTFAEAARWAGVSPAAPYRHFRDRDELLIDVARRGFDRFAGTLESAWDSGRPDAFAAFDRLGKAYLRFAKSEPAYYSAMFEAGSRSQPTFLDLGKPYPNAVFAAVIFGAGLVVGAVVGVGVGVGRTFGVAWSLGRAAALAIRL